MAFAGTQTQQRHLQMEWKIQLPPKGEGTPQSSVQGACKLASEDSIRVWGGGEEPHTTAAITLCPPYIPGSTLAMKIKPTQSSTRALCLVAGNGLASVESQPAWSLPWGAVSRLAPSCPLYCPDTVCPYRSVGVHRTAGQCQFPPRGAWSSRRGSSPGPGVLMDSENHRAGRRSRSLVGCLGGVNPKVPVGRGEAISLPLSGTRAPAGLTFFPA
ncbi:UNVERIFIED_CONTAM: hypothetical protein K2H54_037489 [Gekko kuhli]